MTQLVCEKTSRRLLNQSRISLTRCGMRKRVSPKLPLAEKSGEVAFAQPLQTISILTLQVADEKQGLAAVHFYRKPLGHRQ